ncbi:MAG: T9SS type A sorting domain-containing protein, partial [Bacteroidota bacterium]
EPDCAIPSNLEATNIQARQATLTWDAVDGANNYTVQLRAAGSSNWNTRTAPSNTGNAKPLRPNTTYEWHVRANCDDESSEYSPIVSFMTAANNRKRLENRGGTVEINSNDIQLFPNPANTLLNIKSSETITRIEVLDITGRLVMTKAKLDAGQPIQLDVSNLTDGQYSIRLQTASNLTTLKFVKQ